MAITRYGELVENPLNIDADGILTYSETQKYEADDGERPYDISQHQDVPKIGEPHDTIPDVFVDNVSVKTVVGGEETNCKFLYNVITKYTGYIDSPPAPANADNVDFLIRSKIGFNYTEDFNDIECLFDRAYKHKFTSLSGEVVPSKTLKDSWSDEHVGGVHNVTNVVGSPIAAVTLRTNKTISFSYLVRKKIKNLKSYVNRINSDDTLIVGEEIKKYTALIKHISQIEKEDSRKKMYFQINVTLEIQTDGWGQRMANMGYQMYDYVYEFGDTNKTTVVPIITMNGFIDNSKLKLYRIYTCNRGRFGLTIDNKVATGEPESDGTFLGTGYGPQDLLQKQIIAYYNRHKNDSPPPKHGPSTQEELNDFLNNISPVDEELPLPIYTSVAESRGLSFTEKFQYNINYIDYLDKKVAKFDSLTLPKDITKVGNASYNRYLRRTGGHTTAGAY
jgi:hypothetical protein